MALVLKKGCLLAGIKRNVNLDRLRHSYAIPLLEAGTDLRYIQALIGHRSSRATKIYTHIIQKSLQHIISPLDKITGDLKIRKLPYILENRMAWGSFWSKISYI